MDKLVNKVIRIFEKNNIVTEKNIEVVHYGMELLFLKILFYAIVLFVGVIMNSVIEMMIFMLFYEPLRIYAGGYHAKTRLNCFFSSFFMLIAVVSAIKFTPDAVVFYLSAIFTLISGIIIWITVPVETRNKPFDNMEINVYRKRARLILLFEIVIVIASVILKQHWLSFVISLGLVCTSVLLLTGYCYNCKISKVK